MHDSLAGSFAVLQVGKKYIADISMCMTLWQVVSPFSRYLAAVEMYEDLVVPGMMS